jgi:hypothetical protein
MTKIMCVLEEGGVSANFENLKLLVAPSSFMKRISNLMEASSTAMYSLLSDKAILRSLENGKVVISDFSMDNLNTSSYDVTLGPYFFREVCIFSPKFLEN